MKKDEIFDLIIKAFGVYLLVLAIIALPAMINGAFMLSVSLSSGPIGDTGSLEGGLRQTLQTNYMSASVGAIARFVIYLIVSINFLRSGSWVKKLMKNNSTSEQTVD